MLIAASSFWPGVAYTLIDSWAGSHGGADEAGNVLSLCFVLPASRAPSPHSCIVF